jgi:hypothetical protein
MPNITPSATGATTYNIAGSKGLIVDLNLDVPIFSPFPTFELTYPTAAAGIQIKLLKGALELTLPLPLPGGVTDSATFPNREVVVSSFDAGGGKTTLNFEVKATSMAANDEAWTLRVASVSSNAYVVTQFDNAPGAETIKRVMCDPVAAFQVFPASPVREKTNVSMTAVSGAGTAGGGNLCVVGLPLPTVQYKWTYTGAVAINDFPSCGASQIFSFNTPGLYGAKSIDVVLEVWFDGTCPNNAGFLRSGTAPQTLTIAPRPQHLMLVLDRSGSMSGAKWENTKTAARILVNLFAALRKNVSMGDRVGIVVFEDNTCNWHTPNLDPLIAPVLTVTTPDSADTGICALAMGPAGSCTPIGDGLWKGMQQLNLGAASGDPKFTVILLTDGYENSGTIRVDPNTVVPALSPAVRNFSAARNDFPSVNTKLDIFTIGVGSTVQEDVLNALPLPAGAGAPALYRHVTDVNQIKEAISHMVGFSQEAQMIVPLPPALNPTDVGATTGLDPNHRFFNVEAGVARLVLAAEWASAADNLVLEKRDWSGGGFAGSFSTVTPHTLQRCAQHGFAYVDLASLFGGDETAVPATQWRLLHASGGGSAAIPDTDLMIFADLFLKLDIVFDKLQYRTGDQMTITARLRAGHKPVTKARITVELARPGTALGTFLATNAGRYRPTRPSGKDPNHPKAQMIASLLKNLELNEMPIVRPKKFFIDGTDELFDDGKHQDGVKRDGNFANTYDKVDLEGTYTFRFYVEGVLPDGSPFNRLLTVSKWVGMRIDLNNSKFESVRLERVRRGFVGYQIRFLPLSGNKQFLGPFRPTEMKFKASAGSFEGEVKSLPDGWYTRDLMVPRELADKPVAVTVIAQGQRFDFALKNEKPYNR